MSSRLQDVLLRGLRSAQPLATDVATGTLFFVTDEGVTEQSDGSAWNTYSGTGGGGGGIALAAGTQVATSGTVNFGNANGVTFGMSGSTAVTASVNTNYAGTGLTTATTTGSVLFGTNSSNGLSLGVPVWITTGGGGGSVNISAGTTSNNLTALTFSNASGVSFGLNGSVITATVQTNYQSSGAYLTTAALSQDSSKYAGTNGAITGGSITVNTSGVSVNLPAYLTTALASNAGSNFVQATAAFAGTNASGTINSTGISVSVAPPSAGSVNISAGTTSSNLTAFKLIDSNGVSWSLDTGSKIYATVNTYNTTSYNTAGSATTVYDVASANATGTVTRWALEDHRHAGIGALGISTVGNSSGTSGSVQGTYWLQGGSNITISQITSNNGSHTAVISAKPVGYAGWLEPYPLTATATFAPGAGTWYLAPFTAFGSMSGGRINVLVNNTGTANLFLDVGETAYGSNTTGSIQQSYTLSAAVALFSAGTGANSTRLDSLWSNSYSFGWSKIMAVSVSNASNINISMAQSVSYISDIGSDGAYTHVQLAAAGSSTVANSSTASTVLSTVFSSGRNLLSGSVVQPFGFNTTISAGVYWLGYAWSSTRARASTGNLTTGSDFSFGGLEGISRLELNSVYRNFGSTATGPRSAMVPYGLYTAAANMVPPATIAISSDLSSLASQWVPYFNFQNRGLTK
jgi:hypothetical protein